MTIRRAAAIVAVFMGLFPVMGSSEPVTLTSRDGSIVLSGELLGFDGEIYRIDSFYGPLSVDGSGMRCEGPGCPGPGPYLAELRFSGAASMGAVLMPALLDSFASRRGLSLRRIQDDATRISYALTSRKDGAEVGLFHFHLTSSDEGFADMVAGEADIALSLREVSAQEIAIAREAGLDDLGAAERSRIVALDALVPIVSIANPVAAVRFADLAAIFDGRVTRWSELGGADVPIALHLRPENQGLTQAFARRVVQNSDLIAGITFHDSDRALAQAVADDPHALGIGRFSEMGDAVPLVIRGPCGMESAPSLTNIKTEDYPLTAPLFAYLPPWRLPKLARDFMVYIGSPAAQAVIRRAGLVDQFPQAIPFQRQGVRFANAIMAAGTETSLSELQRMVRALQGHSRLTVTFRFEGGASDLDAQSRSNVELLAEALERGVFRGRRLIFVGFSDGQGSGSINRRLSADRAEAVRDAVSRAARRVDATRLDLGTEAFGEAMPMACDEVGWGRRVNRRVEVWLERER